MYDIVADDLFNQEYTKEYILSIQVSLGGFSFSVFSGKESRLVAWKGIPLTITSRQFLPRRFQEWTEKEEIFHKEFKEVCFVFDTKEFIPVPDKYYNETEKTKLTELVFDLESETEIETNKVGTLNLWLLFTLPKLLKEKIAEQFPGSKIIHPLKNCLGNLPQTDPGKTGLIILFSSKYFYVVLFGKEKLLLANSFSLTHKNDIIFYTLSVLKQFKTAPSKTEVFLAGDIPGGEETMKEISKYFSSTQFLKPSKKIQINNHIFNEPEYGLYNLLNSIS